MAPQPKSRPRTRFTNSTGEKDHRHQPKLYHSPNDSTAKPISGTNPDGTADDRTREHRVRLNIPGERTDKEVASQLRNQKRVTEANQKDIDTLGKYLPETLEEVFVDVVTGADDFFVPPKWLIQAVAEVTETVVETPKESEIMFDTTEGALEHNSELLRQHDFDFESFLASQRGSTLDYGSEFRPIAQLEKVLGNHPNFDFFKDVLQNGMKYHFVEELNEEDRKVELKEQISRGNHKSAQDEIEVATKLLKKDVAHGFAMPVHKSIVENIRGAMVQPGGVANQFKLQADGTRQLAARLTHDLSYGISKDRVSVNNRIDMDQYVEMIYGWCLSRVIHFIVALRLAHPDKSIFIVKYDYSDAYRRVAHAANAAVQTILIVANVAYIMLRLAFGGSPNPPTWCAFSEMVTDLSNEIDLCDDWDHTKLRSPAQRETPEPVTMGPEIPFARAKPLAVDIPVHCTVRTDSFIDDLIRIFLDTVLNRERAPHAVPLAIHVTSRPHAGNDEPITRRGLLSASKLEAEGKPVEIQVVLGWDLDTRRLLVILPSDKFIAWTGDLHGVITTSKVSQEELESLIGRLNHVAYLIPLSRHFLPRLRRRISRRRHKRQIITLSKEEVSDLLLWAEFLLMARNGISMNRLTIRRPSCLGFGDSCPFGLGGMSFFGRAWRLTIPTDSPLYGVSEANNIFEFLAMAITLWIIILECDERGTTEECILILGDSTSALGWLYKIRHFAEDSFYHHAVNLIARKIARLVMNSTHALASQHLKGSLNVVADLLSYHGKRGDKQHPLAADNPPDDILTQRFHAHLPQLIPKSFAICPLPEEILSFAMLVLRTTESSFMQSKKLPTKTGIESGVDGEHSAPSWVSPITNSSLVYPQSSERSWPELSSPFTEELNGIRQADMLANVKNQWWQTLSAMPQAIWLRRFGTISNKAPFTSKAARGSFNPSKTC